MNRRHLYRSANDRWIGGVAAGVADYFDVDPVIVRILWIVSLPFSGFLTLVVYIIMLIVVPEAPAEWPQPSPWQPGGAPLGYGASFTPAPDQAGAPGSAPAYAASGPTDPNAPASDPGVTGSTAGPGAQVPPSQGWDTGWAGRQDRWQRRADRWQRRADRWQERADHRGSGGIVFGAILIVVGGLLAWHQIDPSLDLALAWPVAIVAFGVFLVATSVDFRRGQ